jgi:hypothetical protein
VYQQQQQQQQEQQEEQDAENPFLDPPFSRIKKVESIIVLNRKCALSFATSPFGILARSGVLASLEVCALGLCHAIRAATVLLKRVSTTLRIVM